jgi:hypothetical protein
MGRGDKRGILVNANGTEGPTKAERRAARETIGRYHEAKLAELIERVREALARLDVGEIDVSSTM